MVTERYTFRNDLGSNHREHVLEIGRRFESREPETGYARKEIHVISAAQYSMRTSKDEVFPAMMARRVERADQTIRSSYQKY